MPKANVKWHLFNRLYFRTAIFMLHCGWGFSPSTATLAESETEY
jgi:hypothetical protein